MARSDIRTVGQLKEALSRYSDGQPIALLDLASMYCQHFNVVAVPNEVNDEHEGKPTSFIALTFDSTDDERYGHAIDTYKVDWSR